MTAPGRQRHARTTRRPRSRGAMSRVAGLVAARSRGGRSPTATARRSATCWSRTSSPPHVVPPVPLDWCGAQTQGTIGFSILDALDDGARATSALDRPRGCARHPHARRRATTRLHRADASRSAATSPRDEAAGADRARPDLAGPRRARLAPGRRLARAARGASTPRRPARCSSAGYVVVVRRRRRHPGRPRGRRRAARRRGGHRQGPHRRAPRRARSTPTSSSSPPTSTTRRSAAARPTQRPLGAGHRRGDARATPPTASSPAAHGAEGRGGAAASSTAGGRARHHLAGPHRRRRRAAGTSAPSSTPG